MKSNLLDIIDYISNSNDRKGKVKESHVGNWGNVSDDE